MAPSCLGAIKGTHRRMEQYTKHLLNILRRRDFAFTHLEMAMGTQNSNTRRVLPDMKAGTE
jgi:hypothetical protein